MWNALAQLNIWDIFAKLNEYWKIYLYTRTTFNFHCKRCTLLQMANCHYVDSSYLSIWFLLSDSILVFILSTQKHIDWKKFILARSGTTVVKYSTGTTLLLSISRLFHFFSWVIWIPQFSAYKFIKHDSGISEVTLHSVAKLSTCIFKQFTVFIINSYIRYFDIREQGIINIRRTIENGIT